MTLTLDTALEEELQKHPEVLELLPVLIREQIELEKWRKRTFQPEHRERAKRLIQEGQSMDISPEEASKKLEASIQRIQKRLEE